MQCQASEAEIKRAQQPHNLLIAGLFGFNLLMAPAVLALKIGMIGLLIPLLSSGGLIVFVKLRSTRPAAWFVAMHWKLAYRNSRWLLLGYAVSAVMIFLGWLVSLNASSVSMGHIIWTALTRIAILPTLAAVMVTAISEASAISLASKREVPDKLAAQFPPQS
ncbi:MAG: hypothetical protein PHH47_08890 [Gallionella sp.]|nr:hypothetical protein [Gallionella sp.]MDD4946772.1 hypothetical protein [Gallionella sp.]MDD5612222.1 hypothetical protein [Gallionella sp.]